MSKHDMLHAFSDVDSHEATAWRFFMSDASGMKELAFGTDGQFLRSAGATSDLEFVDAPRNVGVSCSGVTPVVADFSALDVGTFGFAIGTGGRIWKYIKTGASDIVSAELGAIPES